MVLIVLIIMHSYCPYRDELFVYSSYHDVRIDSLFIVHICDTLMYWYQIFIVHNLESFFKPVLKYWMYV